MYGNGWRTGTAIPIIATHQIATRSDLIREIDA
jgi:hypothetical protein